MVGRRAPDFPAGLRWLNVSRPLSLHTDLKGRFVLLDFWTYCCINCMHVLPELKKLEKEFPELLVIGVHSAKFDNESDIENIRSAILRYDIEHPVLVDEGYRVWQLYDAHAWPTFVLIGPRGDVLWRSSGEGIYDALAPRLREWIKAYQTEISLSPIPWRLEKHSRATGLLAFPGKITVVRRPSQKQPYLYFTDSNHNRIIGITLEGQVVEVIGSGNEGWKDGSFTEAEFFRPQGLAYHPEQDALYVADTENHLIRRVWLREKRVETLAGTGQQARRLLREGHGPHTPLNSPWDVALNGRTLYIAMAGFHQLWEMDIEMLHLRVFAGSGYENLMDGSRLVAALAQPSGLALGPDGRLYFADSETSSIRFVEKDQVRTLVGKGLFDFGYRDGTFGEALLQHPIGLTYHESKLYVADTYNHAIRVLDLTKGTVTTLVGTGQRGYKDGPAREAQLNEPNDLLWVEGYLYIVDTNNHLLRRYDPRTDQVQTVELSPASALQIQRVRTHSLFDSAVELPATEVPMGPFRLQLKLPEGYLLNTEMPPRLYIGEKRFLLSDSLPALSEPTTAYLEVYVCEGKEVFSRCLRWTYSVKLVPTDKKEGEVFLPLPVRLGAQKP
ncbi:MAG: thioredoxin-like domain-containing protein [Bacteroidia bacterium]|nr:thioredoxin-like domain-containing protein [Bacteroidia bacterium]